MNVILPYPMFILLIGPAASGKSTFASRFFTETEILSSDKFRAAVCDDVKNQSVSGDAFEILHLIASKRIGLYRLTVIDATNTQQPFRKKLLELNNSIARLPVAAIVFNFSEQDCIHLDKARKRQVGPEVIRTHVKQLRESIEDITSEGYTLILNIKSPREASSINLHVLRS